jgi:DNA-binding NarL/FixJ family response regulator
VAAAARTSANPREEGKAAPGPQPAPDLSRSLDAHRAVSDALANWEDEGFERLLRELCGAMGWEVGMCWIPDAGADVLECVDFWSAPGLDASAFEEATRSFRYPAANTFPGRAWRSREVLFIRDLSQDGTYMRRDPALQARLQSAVAFPAQTNDEVLAVLEFLSGEATELGEEAIEALTAIGSQLGESLSHRRAALSSPPLTAREVEVLQLAADGHGSRQIADKLFVSEATVKTHFNHVFAKLGAHDRTAAVAQAMRFGLIR